MLKKLVLLKLLKKHFKFIDAFALLVGITNGSQKIYLPKIKRHVYIRPQTKDLETFEEIFLTNLYNTTLPIKVETIIDAGANVGFASLFFKLKYPNASIVAIEIEEKNTSMIKLNTENLTNFELLQKALYNSKAFFKIEDPFHATNSFVIKKVSAHEPFDIESVTIDEIIEQKNWQTIDVLKIDIEGAEKELFSDNYQKWLPKVKVLMVETHDRMVLNCSYTIFDTLKEYNFILYTTTEGTLIFYNMDLIHMPK